MSVDPCAPAAPAPSPPAKGSAPDNLNAWMAPGFSPLAFFRQMIGTLRGVGGLVEQSCHYFDHAGAMDWMRIARQTDYAEAHRVMPLDRAAAQIVRALGTRDADLIALGPGDGRLETRCVGHMADLLSFPALRYYLLDISQPLLAEAYRHASATLGLFEGITPIAILGNFHDLPQYGQLSYAPLLAPRAKIILMLGGTFGNLENEGRFLRDSLCGFPAGTLLLVDYPTCFAPADDPAAIHKTDPWLAQGGSVAWRERVTRFWTGPLRRYTPGFAEVKVHTQLSRTANLVPGGYAIEAMAQVLCGDGSGREFSVFRLKRYDTLALTRYVRELGWAAVDGWVYGQDVGYPRALSLLRKQ